MRPPSGVATTAASRRCEADRRADRARRPAGSYAWQVGNALDEGATPEGILGVLRAVGPHVGGPRVVAAAPEITLALGLALPGEQG